VALANITPAPHTVLLTAASEVVYYVVAASVTRFWLVAFERIVGTGSHRK
jgi:hypothetical protein